MVSVDWHRGDQGAGHGWTLPEFADALVKHGLFGKVVAVVGRSEVVGPHLAGPFDLVWIDAAHDELSVAADTRLALRLLAPGGVIAWHDWNYASVRAGAGRLVDVGQCRPAAGNIATWSGNHG